jgi:hypothetical protein
MDEHVAEDEAKRVVEQEIVELLASDRVVGKKELGMLGRRSQLEPATA